MSNNTPGKRKVPLFRKLLCDFGNNGEKIPNQSQVRYLKDWRVSIFVDRNNSFRIFHAGQVLLNASKQTMLITMTSRKQPNLNSTRDSHGNVQLRGDDFAGLSNLQIIGNKSCVHCCSGCSDCGTKRRKSRLMASGVVYNFITKLTSASKFIRQVVQNLKVLSAFQTATPTDNHLRTT